MIDEQDTAKLHNEISQYVSQCFTIALGAMTVFGVIGGWILGGSPKDIQEGTQLYIKIVLSILLLTVLFILFYISQVTLNRLHVVGAYLRLRGLSLWELHYDKFNSESSPPIPPRCFDQERPLLVLFFMLGIATSFLPLVLMLIKFQSNLHDLIDYIINNKTILIVYIFISFTYLLTIFLAWTGKFFRFPKDDVERLWRKIISETSAQKGTGG